METDIRNAFENIKFKQKLFQGYDPVDVKRQVGKLTNQWEESMNGLQAEIEAVSIERDQLKDKNVEAEKLLLETRRLLEETGERLNEALANAKSYSDEASKVKSEYEQKSVLLCQYMVDAQQKQTDILARAEREARYLIAEAKEKAIKERSIILAEQEQLRQKAEDDWKRISMELRQSMERADAAIQNIEDDLDSTRGKFNSLRDVLLERSVNDTDYADITDAMTAQEY